MSAGRAAGGVRVDATRGVAWMVLGSGFYSLVYAVVRLLAESFSTYELVLIRAVFGSLFVLPFVAAVGFRVLKTGRWKLYGLRVALAYAGTAAWMYGIANMPLAEANALLFTGPLFTVVFAALFLRERVGPHRWAATAVGFLGALIILRPGVVPVGLPALSTIAAAALFASSHVATKSLTGTEHPNAVVFYLYFLMIPVAAGPAAWHWTMPTIEHLGWFVALGVVTVGAQQGATRAFANAPASVVMPVSYLQLPMVAAVAWLAFGQTASLWTWLGAAVICTSTYSLARREARRR